MRSAGQSAKPHLISEVVNELRVLPVFAHEGLAQLKHGRVDGDSAVALEDGGDDVEGVLADGHLVGEEVARALGHLRSQKAAHVKTLARRHRQQDSHHAYSAKEADEHR